MFEFIRICTCVSNLRVLTFGRRRTYKLFSVHSPSESAAIGNGLKFILRIMLLRCATAVIASPSTIPFHECGVACTRCSCQRPTIFLRKRFIFTRLHGFSATAARSWARAQHYSWILVAGACICPGLAAMIVICAWLCVLLASRLTMGSLLWRGVGAWR